MEQEVRNRGGAALEAEELLVLEPDGESPPLAADAPSQHPRRPLWVLPGVCLVALLAGLLFSRSGDRPAPTAPRREAAAPAPPPKARAAAQREAAQPGAPEPRASTPAPPPVGAPGPASLPPMAAPQPRPALPAPPPPPPAAPSRKPPLLELAELLCAGAAALQPQLRLPPRVRVPLAKGGHVELRPDETLVELKNGNHFVGRLLGTHATELRLALPEGEIRLPLATLARVRPRTASDRLPVTAFPWVRLPLRNGQVLRGHLLAAAADRFVLAYPAARIIVPAVSVVPEAAAALRARLAAADRPAATPLLASPFTAPGKAFRLRPPAAWEPVSLRGLLAFRATPQAAHPGALLIGGVRLLHTPTLEGWAERLRARAPAHGLRVGAVRPAHERPWEGTVDLQGEGLSGRIYLFLTGGGKGAGHVFALAFLAPRAACAPRLWEAVARTFSPG